MNTHARPLRASTPLLTALFATLAACTERAGPAEPGEPTGTYRLVERNGERLPVVVVQDPDFPARTEIAGGRLHLAPDGTYEEATALRTVVYDEAAIDTLRDRGTYRASRAGNEQRIEFHSTEGFGTFYGRLDGRRLTTVRTVALWGPGEQYTWARE